MVFDAVIVLGGGLEADGEIPKRVKVRFDHASEILGSSYLIAASAGTPHKPAVIDNAGRPILESVAGAKYAMTLGISAGKILTEEWSHDTIGNAFFTRVVHCELRKFKRLCIITSDFHLPRAKEIFRFVYSLPPSDYDLSFVGTPDVGLSPGVLQERINKEKIALENFRKLKSSVSSIMELHKWLFTKHDVYSAGRSSKPIKGTALGSY